MPLIEHPDNTYEYIIVGAGASGCVVANRLSRNHKTLLLEAGSLDSSWELLMPQNCGNLWGNEKFSWNIKSETQKELSGNSLSCIVGRVLGGSAAISAMCWLRGHPSGFNSWKNHGIEGWNYTEVLPYLKRVEGCTFKCDQNIRGVNGPMKLTRAEEDSYGRALLSAAEQLGYGVSEDLNGDQVEGFGIVESQTYRGVRWSPSRAYLHPILNRTNLHIVCNAMVSKILIENSFATGVEFLDRASKEVLTVNASKEVIVCAGGILSPKLLILSGLADKEELDQLGIDCVRNIPGVGKGLKVPVLVPIVTSNKSSRNYYYGEYGDTFKRKDLASRDWFLNHSGPHTSLGQPVSALIRTKNNLPHPNVMLMFMNSIFAPVPRRDGFQMDHKEQPGYSCVVTTIPCHSTGSVTLKTRDPWDDPIVHCGLLKDKRDLENAKEAIKAVRSIFMHDQLKDEVDSVVMPDSSSVTDSDIENYIRKHAECHQYYIGSCRMGSYGDPTAVTDNQGRVWGVGNLRVIDSSIVPEYPGGSMVPVCMMVAERICDTIDGKKGL